MLCSSPIKFEKATVRSQQKIFQANKETYQDNTKKIFKNLKSIRTTTWTLNVHAQLNWDTNISINQSKQLSFLQKKNETCNNYFLAFIVSQLPKYIDSFICFLEGPIPMSWNVLKVAFSEIGFLYEVDIDAVMALINADMLEFDVKMSSKMDSVLEKNYTFKKFLTISIFL